MLDSKEILLLKHMRNNSRKSLNSLSKESGIPTSTLFDILKRLEKKIVIKHVSLVDFSKLGYNIKTVFSIKTNQKKEIKDFLINEKNVNSLSSLINGFHAECIFRDLKEMDEFKERLKQFQTEEINEFFIVDEIKRESFEL
jgi:DNA-binding Lrp family transcriptional regulator